MAEEQQQEEQKSECRRAEKTHTYFVDDRGAAVTLQVSLYGYFAVRPNQTYRHGRNGWKRCRVIEPNEVRLQDSTATKKKEKKTPAPALRAAEARQPRTKPYTKQNGS